MQSPFTDDADTVQFTEPMPPTDNTYTAPATADRASDLDEATTLEADQPSMPAIDKAELLTMVKQTIDDLESQGVLMLFDPHDRVAQRLTGDLLAAGATKGLAVE